jgi:prevent-host-death family protein
VARATDARKASGDHPSCYACYARDVQTISQREMRNDSGEVLRSVAAGESYTVTRNGTPVARIVPLDGPAPLEMRAVRPATTSRGFARLPRVRRGSSAAVLDDLRDER